MSIDLAPIGNYSDVGGSGHVECDRCGAWVRAHGTDLHTEWHLRLQANWKTIARQLGLKYHDD